MAPDSKANSAASLVSILLACRDGARHLPEALASIDAQTYRPIELLAVNDGSSDATGEILRSFAAARPWVQVIAAPGIGPAAARTLAYRASCGPLIAIHDADDVSRPDRFERQAAYLASHPHVGVLGSAAEVIDESGVLVAAYPVPLAPRAIRRVLRRASPFVHGSVMMLREAYESAGGFREGFRAAEDYDLWLRVPERFELANLSAPLYQWRAHAGNSFSRHRDQHLEYLALARAFADERRLRGSDSAAALRTAESPAAFRRVYSHAHRLSRYRAEALIRDGRTAAGRSALGEAWNFRELSVAAASLFWWLVSWPVELTPRARRARAGVTGPSPRGTAR